MEQNLSFIRVSELLKMAKHEAEPKPSNSDHALGLMEQVFRSIDDMSLEEREEVMRRLTAWMIVEKFEAKGHSALVGFQRYCIADCLYEDPNWSIPEDIIAPKLLSGSY